MLVAVMCQFSVDNYLSSLPYLTKLFHAKASTLRLTVVIFMVGAGIAALFFGILSDRIGRKRSLIFALLIFLLGNLICVFALNAAFLLVGRLLQGMGTGGCLTLNRVILCDVTDDQTELARFGSYLSMAISTIPAISTAIGAYIFVHLGWRANFIVLLIAAIIAVVFIWKLLPETQQQSPTIKTANKITTDIKQVLTTPVFIGFLICAGLVTTAALALLSIGPHLFQTALHLTPIQYGYVAFFIGLSMIFGSYCNALLVKHIGLRKTVDTGLIIILFSSIAMLAAYFLGYVNVFVILIPAMIYLFGADFISTNAYAGAVSSLKSTAGTATALYNQTDASIRDL